MKRKIARVAIGGQDSRSKSPLMQAPLHHRRSVATPRVFSILANEPYVCSGDLGPGIERVVHGDGERHVGGIHIYHEHRPDGFECRKSVERRRERAVPEAVPPVQTNRLSARHPLHRSI